jgi:membrane-associated phospholipid phosphatase
MSLPTTRQLALVSLGCVILFAGLTAEVFHGGFVVRIDNRLSFDVLVNQWSPARHLADVFSDLGRLHVVIGLLAGATVVMAARRDWRRAVLVPVASAAVLGFGRVVQKWVGRSGPTGGSRIHIAGAVGGYPSGSALGAALAFAAIAMAIRHRHVTVAAAALALIVAASRVYAFAHFPSDVLASLLAAGACTAAIEAVGTMGQTRPLRPDPSSPDASNKESA